MLYTEVLSGLWIARDIMYNKKIYRRFNQIKLIINCTIDYKFNIKVFKMLEFLYLIIFIIQLIQLSKIKTKILNFIDSNLDNNHILICCRWYKYITFYSIFISLLNMVKKQIKVKKK